MGGGRCCRPLGASSCIMGSLLTPSSTDRGQGHHDPLLSVLHLCSPGSLHLCAGPLTFAEHEFDSPSPEGHPETRFQVQRMCVNGAET